MMSNKFTRFALAAVLAGSVAPAFGQATKPATKPAAPTAAAVVPDDLVGPQLAIRAQQAFSRGEYATALPMLRKMAAEAEGQPAKLSSIQERIRVSEKALASAKAEADKKVAQGVDPKAAPAAGRPDATPEARKPHVPPAAGAVYDTEIQALGNFEYDQEKGGNIPADVAKLSGSKVRLKGYMIPMDQADNITQFALVPSLFACCFGQPPQIQHTIVATTPKGKSVGYTADEILVEGTLKVQEKKDDGYIVSVFEMDVASVKLAPKG
ncbi:MAG: hypothetical protein JWO31_1782 [Phycisphaerales bacterium]|nr:hypothetical protein [Phycisphaerales bacterium]